MSKIHLTDMWAGHCVCGSGIKFIAIEEHPLDWCAHYLCVPAALAQVVPTGPKTACYGWDGRIM